MLPASVALHQRHIQRRLASRFRDYGHSQETVREKESDDRYLEAVDCKAPFTMHDVHKGSR